MCLPMLVFVSACLVVSVFLTLGLVYRKREH